MPISKTDLKELIENLKPEQESAEVGLPQVKTDYLFEGDFNTLLRNNAATVCDTLVDIAANTVFDTRADASNATYYHADKTHLVTAGQNICVTAITAAIQPYI